MLDVNENIVTISTHTPHARRDVPLDVSRRCRAVISTHTLHARREYSAKISGPSQSQFLLTRLMRGVT